MPVAHLGHVEHLDAVMFRLASDDDVVLVPADLTPDGRLGGARLGQAAQVDELALPRDFGEGRAVCLGNDHELPTVAARPPPRGGALAGLAAKIGMAHKVVEVDLPLKSDAMLRSQAESGSVVHTFLQRNVFNGSPGTTWATPFLQRIAPFPPLLLYFFGSIAPFLVWRSHVALCVPAG